MLENSESARVEESLDANDAARIEPPDDPVMAVAVEQESPPRWRELLAVLLFVVLVDVTIYRGYGFAGYALLMAAAPLLLAVGAPRPRWKAGGEIGETSAGPRTAFSAPVLIVGAMLLVLAAKLVWCGSVLQAAVGFALIATFAAALAGVCPYVFEVIVLITQIIPAGFLGLKHYERSASILLVGSGGRAGDRGSRTMSILLPLVALASFGMLFILANPDLMTAFGETVARYFAAARDC